VSPSNHPYRSHVTNGGGKPSNWLRLVCPLNWQGWLAPGRWLVPGRWWKSDPRNWEDGGSLTQETIRTFHGHSGRIRKMLENVRQPLPEHGYGGSSHSPCGYNCTLCAESFESLKSFEKEPIVLSSVPIVVLEMGLVYGMYYNIDHLIMLLIITCHSFTELYANLQTPINPYCIHQIFMLELSLASTQYTHGAAVKLFYR
jgi:hypothetical protein